MVNTIIYILAFGGIWIGSGVAIKSVERVAKILNISSFAVSFLVLGLFTSMSELSVGVNAVMRNDPKIYMGNLIGASIVLFLLAIPLLALMGNKVIINKEFQGFNLPAALVVIALPAMLAMDGVVDRTDSILAMVLYGLLVVAVETKKGIWEKIKDMNGKTGFRIGREIIKIIFGVVVIFIASRLVVEQTEFFSTLLGVSPFLISLLVIGVGTNIPELSLAVRSAFMKNNQAAFGDYVGSAAFNTFLMGALTVGYGRPVALANSYAVSLGWLIGGLGLFYLFARSKNTISKVEGGILLMLYGGFLAAEVILHKLL